MTRLLKIILRGAGICLALLLPLVLAACGEDMKTQYVPDDECAVKPYLRIQVADQTFYVPRHYKLMIGYSYPKNKKHEICQGDGDPPFNRLSLKFRGLLYDEQGPEDLAPIYGTFVTIQSMLAPDDPRRIPDSVPNESFEKYLDTLRSISRFKGEQFAGKGLLNYPIEQNFYVVPYAKVTAYIATPQGQHTPMGYPLTIVCSGDEIIRMNGLSGGYMCRTQYLVSDQLNIVISSLDSHQSIDQWAALYNTVQEIFVSIKKPPLENDTTE